jgi:nucleotide-binding universal stress UspA family protein
MAADIALRFGSKVTVAYVIPRLLLPPDAYGLTLAEMEREQRAYAEKLVAEAAAKLGEPGLDLQTRVLSGSPPECLAEVAEAPDVDLVVIGSRGRGAVARALLGSVSGRLVHICPKPVLVVH